MIEVIPVQNDKSLLDKAFHIRERVFVIEQEVDPELEYDEFEQESTHYLALHNGEPAGTARWRRTPKGIKLERFAVLKQARGNCVGAALVQACLQDVLKEQADKIYLHAQVQVIPFYERFGFTAEGEEFVEADIRHRVMYHSPAVM